MPLPLLLLVVLLMATPALAAPVEVLHQPLSCVPRAGHAVVSASASRVDDVATVELQFRRGDKGGWYAIPMFLDGEAWTARLPRPEPRLKELEYRVVMTSTNLEPSALAPIRVPVTPSCVAPAEPSVTSSIVVRAPRGASALPDGFEPDGLVAADGAALPEDLDVGTSIWAKVIAGGAVAGGVAAIALGKRGELVRPGPPGGFGYSDNPGFAFSHTVPPSGSVVAPGDTVTLFVNMLREPAYPLDLEWRLELAVAADSPACATVEGRFDDARSPLGLVMIGPLRSSGSCGDRFDVSAGRLLISMATSPWAPAGTVLLNDVYPLSFHIEP